MSSSQSELDESNHKTPTTPTPTPTPTTTKIIWEIFHLIDSQLINSIHRSLLPQLDRVYHQLSSYFDSFSLLNPSSSSSSDHHLPLLSSIIIPSYLTTTTISSQTTPLPPPSLHPSSSSIPLNSHHLILLLLLPPLYLASKLSINYLLRSYHLHRFISSHPTISSYLIPNSISSLITRPITRSSSSSHPQIIIILGADPGSVGHLIALHLSQIGLTVIASVSCFEFVDSLTNHGSGFIKPLVFDSSLAQIHAFNRSLAACLDLYSPSSSSFHPPNPHLLPPPPLLALINCLPISSSHLPRPIESIDLDHHLLLAIRSLLAPSLEVIKFILPIMRHSIQSAHHSHHPLILTLFPTKTNSVSLPYLGPSTIANQALETLMSTLRREILISNSNSPRSIRIINERIGSFRPSPHLSTKPIVDHPPASLPTHLHPIYAPSLSRRLGLFNAPSITITAGLPILSISGSPLSQLIQRVQHLIESPSITSGSSLSAGREVWKFKLIESIVPDWLLDRWLTLAESLNGWVRRQLISEIDLESDENLERVIQKRQLSSQSGWKHRFFIPSHPDLHHPSGRAPSPEDQNQEELVEADTTIVKIESVEPEGFDRSSAEEELESVEETGSVIDRGPPESEPVDRPVEEDDPSVQQDHLKHSFVGSEIDWKEEQA